MILAPTRELAVQIHKDAELLARHTGYRLVLVFGGTGYDSQRRSLEEGVDVLIGTPGRIIDYLKQQVFTLSHVQVMVLDEADRMFDLGFIKDIRFLLRKMPEPARRLNMLFSATLSCRVMELAHEHMNEPETVRIEPDKRTADKVTQLLYHTAMEEKLPLLVSLLRHHGALRSLVFINTKDMAEHVAATLKANGLEAAVLSGDVPQTQRMKLLADFTQGDLPVLVATDVAARGLHIPEVSHVFNYDLPQNAEDYVHRIGRTARAGASGDAISFACEKYVFSLPEIEEFIGHKIPVAAITPNYCRPSRPSAVSGANATIAAPAAAMVGVGVDRTASARPGPPLPGTTARHHVHRVRSSQLQRLRLHRPHPHQQHPHPHPQHHRPSTRLARKSKHVPQPSAGLPRDATDVTCRQSADRIRRHSQAVSAILTIL